MNLLTKDEILERSEKTWLNVSGIYFLIKQDIIVYVGQSINIRGRVRTHAKNYDFDYYSYIEISKNDYCDLHEFQDALNDSEAEYIFYYEPLYNKSIPSNKAWVQREKIKQITGFFTSYSSTLDNILNRQTVISSVFNNNRYYNLNSVLESATFEEFIGG